MGSSVKDVQLYPNTRVYGIALEHSGCDVLSFNHFKPYLAGKLVSPGGYIVLSGAEKSSQQDVATTVLEVVGHLTTEDGSGIEITFMRGSQNVRPATSRDQFKRSGISRQPYFEDDPEHYIPARQYTLVGVLRKGGGQQNDPDLHGAYEALVKDLIGAGYLARDPIADLNPLHAPGKKVPLPNAPSTSTPH